MTYDFTTLVDRNDKDAIAVEVIPIPGAEVKPGFTRIPMWVADMNFITAPAVTEKILERAKHPAFGYFNPRQEYTGGIIRWQERRNGVQGLLPEHIGYENGVLGCLSSAILSLTEPGEKILFLSPVYIGFLHTMEATGRTVVRSELVRDEEGTWRMDYADMDRQIRENAIRFCVFCSPHNPCGRVWEREEIEAAMEIFAKNGCTVFSDEIWSDLTMPGKTHIPTQSVSDYAREHVIACYAPSKTFNLAGLVGSYHVIYSEELRKKLGAQAAMSGYNHMNVLSMYALIGGYSEAGERWLDELRTVLFGNLSFACSFIREHFEGVDVSMPEGTYMLFLDCEQWCREHRMSMDDLLKAGVSVGVIWQDGRAFGGDYTIRMNLALPRKAVEEAFGRLGRYVFA